MAPGGSKQPEPGDTAQEVPWPVRQGEQGSAKKEMRGCGLEISNQKRALRFMNVRETLGLPRKN